MKRVIGGAVYDTETANLLYEEKDIQGGPEFFFQLYRSKSGKYFCCTLTEKDIDSRGVIILDRVITPMTRGLAIVTICRLAGVEKAVELFGRREEGVKQVNLRLPVWAYDILRETAAERGVSMAKVVTDMIEGSDDDNVPDFDVEAQYDRYLASLPDDEIFGKFREEEAQRAADHEMAVALGEALRSGKDPAGSCGRLYQD